MRPIFTESNGAIIILTWWSEMPQISIIRTDEEKARLSVIDKFGDVIPVSALKRFQEALIEVLPELTGKAIRKDVYYTSFNTLDNEAAFKLIAKRIEGKKEYLAQTIYKELHS